MPPAVWVPAAGMLGGALIGNNSQRSLIKLNTSFATLSDTIAVDMKTAFSFNNTKPQHKSAGEIVKGGLGICFFADPFFRELQMLL